jgi:hypothetical protein
LKGAVVVGIDLCSRAIEVARRRAEARGVSDRVQFHAAPIEFRLDRDGMQYDIVCGFAALRHLLPIEPTVVALKNLSHQGTRFMFSEPVSLSPFLRRLRLALPVATRGTPGERPLEPADLAILRRHLPRVQVRLFGFLLRPWHRWIGGRVEDHSPFRLFLYDTLARLDWLLLSLPVFCLLASTAVIYTPAKEDPGP